MRRTKVMWSAIRPVVSDGINEKMTVDTASTGDALKAWRRAASAAGLNRGGRITVVDDDKVVTALPDRRITTAHGSFDNDLAAISETLAKITGATPAVPVDDLRGF